MSMAYSDHENGSVLFDPVDNEMGFEWMDPNRRRNLSSLTYHFADSAAIRSNTANSSVVIPPSLCGSKHAHTLLGARSQMMSSFHFDRKAKTHYLLPRVVSTRARLPRQRVRPSTGCQHHFRDRHRRSSVAAGGNLITARLVPPNKVAHIVTSIGISAGPRLRLDPLFHWVR